MNLDPINNSTNSTLQLSGGGLANNDETVDPLPNMLIGALSIAVTAWSFVSMFADNMISTCGFTFGSWSCAGFTSTWIAAWVAGGIELIVWTIAMLVPSFRPVWFLIADIWTYAGAALLVTPIVFWILAITIDSVPFSGALQYNLIVQSVLFAAYTVMHILLVPSIGEWAEATQEDKTASI